MTFEITSLLNNIIREKKKAMSFCTLLYNKSYKNIPLLLPGLSDYFLKIFLLPLDRLKKRDYINYIDIVNFSNG